MKTQLPTGDKHDADDTIWCEYHGMYGCEGKACDSMKTQTDSKDTTIPTLSEPREVGGHTWLIEFPGQSFTFVDKDMAFKIVRAVNSHEALLKTAKAVEEKYAMDSSRFQTVDREWSDLRKAIAHAEGKGE